MGATPPVAYKNAIGARRSSWRTITPIGAREAENREPNLIAQPLATTPASGTTSETTRAGDGARPNPARTHTPSPQTPHTVSTTTKKNTFRP